MVDYRFLLEFEFADEDKDGKSEISSVDSSYTTDTSTDVTSNISSSDIIQILEKSRDHLEEPEEIEFIFTQYLGDESIDSDEGALDI